MFKRHSSRSRTDDRRRAHRTRSRRLLVETLASRQLMSANDPFAADAPAYEIGASAATTFQRGDYGIAEQTGAATYSYPIAVPPGRGGMEPKLALNYSSGAPLRGGIAAGWTLSLPSIQIDTSGGTSGETRFIAALGGTIGRLVETSDFSSRGGQTYRAENDDSFTIFEQWTLPDLGDLRSPILPGGGDVIANTSSAPAGQSLTFGSFSLAGSTFATDQTASDGRYASNPTGGDLVASTGDSNSNESQRTAWLARTTDGVTHYFNLSPSAGDGKTQWFLERQVDRFGNRNDYQWKKVSFDNDAIDFYLSSIEYTSNPTAGLGPHARVDLQYASLEVIGGTTIPIGASSSYRTGELWYSGSRRLTGIVTRVRDSPGSEWRSVRQVGLDYDARALGYEDGVVDGSPTGRASSSPMRYLTGIRTTAFDIEGNPTAVPPVTFTYADDGLKYNDEPETRTAVPPEHGLAFHTSVLMDINGDGIQDQVHARVAGLSSPTPSGQCELVWRQGLYGGGFGNSEYVMPLPTYAWASGDQPSGGERCTLDGQITNMRNTSPNSSIGGTLLPREINRNMYRFADVDGDGDSDLLTALYYNPEYFDPFMEGDTYGIAPTTAKIPTNDGIPQNSTTAINSRHSPPEVVSEAVFVSSKKSNDDDTESDEVSPAPFPRPCDLSGDWCTKPEPFTPPPTNPNTKPSFRDFVKPIHNGANYVWRVYDNTGARFEESTDTFGAPVLSEFELLPGTVSSGTVGGTYNLADADGDGKMDLVDWFRGQTVAVNHRTNRSLADVNGDGLVDIIAIEDGSFVAYLNAGGGLRPTSRSVMLNDYRYPDFVKSIQFSGPLAIDAHYQMDIDQDGLVDLVDVIRNEVRYNLGGEFTPNAYALHPSVVAHAQRLIDRSVRIWDDGELEGGWARVTDFRDADGDGLNDLVGWQQNDGERGPWTEVVFSRDTTAGPPRYLTQIDNGLGGTTQIKYGAITDPRVVSRDIVLDKNVANVSWVVDTITMDDSQSPASITRYSYADPVYGSQTGNDNDPQRFLGFGEVTKDLPHGGRTVLEFNYDIPNDARGHVAVETSYELTSDGTLRTAARTNTNWVNSPLFGGATTFTYAFSTITSTYNDSGSVPQDQIHQRYDTFLPWRESNGQIAMYQNRATTEYTGLYRDDSQTSLTSFITRYTPDLYMVAPSHVSRYEAVPESGGRQMRRISDEYIRYDSQLQAVQIRTKIDDTTWANTMLDYDPATGNLVAEMNPNQAEGSGLKSSFEYDPYSIYVTRTVNELGHQRSNTYDFGTGELLAVRGPNSKRVGSETVWVTQQWIRDGLGRVKERLVSVDDPVAGYELVPVERFTYTDTMTGRHVRSQSRLDFGGEQSRWTVVDQQFDGRGRLRQQVEQTQDPDNLASMVQIIDDGDDGFSTSGDWRRIRNGYNNDRHYSRRGSGADVARWTFDVTPGRYEISASWLRHWVLASDTPFTIYDGSEVLATVDLDQRRSPNDFYDSDAWWEKLGETFDIRSGQIVVEVSDDANRYVMADAIRIEPVAAPPAITSYEYDAGGNLSKIIAPRPGSTDPLDSVESTYDYDSLGRVTEFRRPDGTGTDINYDGLTQTIAELTGDGSGGHKVVNYDAFGRLIRVEEHGRDDTAVSQYEYDGLNRVTSILDADGTLTQLAYDQVGLRREITRGKRTRQYDYDLNGNMIAETTPVPPGADAADYTSRSQYDALDRIISRTPASRGMSSDRMEELGIGETVYRYDGTSSSADNVGSADNAVGMLSRVELPFGQVQYDYNAQSLIEREQRSFTVDYLASVSATQSVELEYNPLGMPTLVRLDDGTTWQTSYDARGLVDSVDWFDPATQQFRSLGDYTRSLGGQIIRRDSDFDQNRIVRYDDRGRPTSDAIFAKDAELASRSYVYNDSGDLVGVNGQTSGISANANFTYDALHRLTSAQGPNGYTGAFTFSAAGNLLTADVDWNDSHQTRNVSYTYGMADAQAVDALIDQASGETWASFDYNTSGAMTRRETPDGVWTFEYDADDMVREADGPDGREAYYYDHNGQRMIAVNESELRFTFGPSETRYSAAGDELLRYAHITGTGGTLARVERDGNGGDQIELQYSDSLQNLILSVDADGEQTAAFLYGPFGEVVQSVGGEDHNRHFNGKEEDSATGLRYYGFRYYDPLTLRWTSADPLYTFAPDMGLTDPQRMNLYAFSLNNPVRYFDPDGLDSHEIEDATPIEAESETIDVYGEAPSDEQYYAWLSEASPESIGKLSQLDMQGMQREAFSQIDARANSQQKFDGKMFTEGLFISVLKESPTIVKHVFGLNAGRVLTGAGLGLTSKLLGVGSTLQGFTPIEGLEAETAGGLQSTFRQSARHQTNTHPANRNDVNPRSSTAPSSAKYDRILR